jgi:hypothetical protein
MSTNVQLRRKKTPAPGSRKRATRLIRELSEDKLNAALPFLEFLKFLDEGDNGKEFDLTDSIKQGIVEMAQLKAGKRNRKSFEALLNEL